MLGPEFALGHDAIREYVPGNLVNTLESESTATPRTKSRWLHRIAAVLFGTAIALVMVVAVDIGWGYIRVRQPGYVRTIIFPGAIREAHPKLGYVLRPNGEARHRTETSQGIVYDVVYTTDDHGRRTTVDPYQSNETFALTFWGCSLTFGTGVADGETLPSRVAELVPQAAVYNYGVEGYGTSCVVMAIRERDLASELRVKNALGIYVFVRHHPWRNLGSLHVSGIWGPGFPAFQMRGDELVYLGSFREAHPLRTRLFSFLAKRPLLAKTDLPISLRRKHLELTVRIIEEAKKEFLAKFPQGEFAVLIYPYRRSEPDLEPFIPMLEAARIRVFDYSTLPLDVPEGPFYPEGHPRAATQAIVAEQLAKDLVPVAKELEERAKGIPTAKRPAAAASRKGNSP